MLQSRSNRVATDSTIDGILKYYYHDDEGEFRFIARYEIDSLLQTPIDTSEYNEYINGILYDFLILEFNLLGNRNTEIFDYLSSLDSIAGNQVLPRFEIVCIDKWEVTQNITFIFLQMGGEFALADAFIHDMQDAPIVETIETSYGTITHHRDCYFVNGTGYYDNMGTNWANWSNWYSWFYNNVFNNTTGGSGGSGSGGSGGSPPLSEFEICMSNFRFGVEVEHLKNSLVDPCNKEADPAQTVMAAAQLACEDGGGTVPSLHAELSAGSQAVAFVLNYGLPFTIFEEFDINTESCCSEESFEDCVFDEVIQNPGRLCASSVIAEKLSDPETEAWYFKMINCHYNLVYRDPNSTFQNWYNIGFGDLCVQVYDGVITQKPAAEIAYTNAFNLAVEQTTAYLNATPWDDLLITLDQTQMLIHEYIGFTFKNYLRTNLQFSFGGVPSLTQGGCLGVQGFGPFYSTNCPY